MLNKKCTLSYRVTALKLQMNKLLDRKLLFADFRSFQINFDLILRSREAACGAFNLREHG